MSPVTRPKPNDPSQLDLSHPDALYEVVDGVVVELPEMGILAVMIAGNLFEALRSYLRQNPLGHAVFEAVLILDAERDLRRRPDVAFVSFERWPTSRPIPEEGDWPVIPDLPIEVLSPNDPSRLQARKLREYFQYGARQVWVVDPLQKLVSVYQSPTKVIVVTVEDELDGGEVLPGFRLPVSRLFQTTFA